MEVKRLVSRLVLPFRVGMAQRMNLVQNMVRVGIYFEGRADRTSW